jgi:hypothetical protein
MNHYAPIVLFAYNRIDELKLTINALQKNLLADKSELFIYSDGARNEENEQKVEEVREYLHSVKGFQKVYIVERDENYGLSKSVIEGVTEIINQYGTVIVIEDDLITSKNFLCYMNKSLEFYEAKEYIFSISGFTMSLKSLNHYQKDTYVALRPASWGWATWKDQWENIDWDVKDYDTFIQDKHLVRAFNRGGIDLARMLKHYMQKKNNSWAIRWAYTMFKEGKYCMYPRVSKVQNIGFGEDATHCDGIHIYKSTLDESTSCDFDFLDEIMLNDEIVTEFKYQYSYRNKLMKKSYKYIKKIFNAKI